MNEPWPQQLHDVLQTGPCVLVTVAGIVGSSPRELGARMLVADSGTFGSVGGGNLEYQAIASAGKMLSRSTRHKQVYDRLGLGPALNQCCGGAVTLLYEYCPSPRLPWLNAAMQAMRHGEPACLLSAVDSPVTRKWVFSPRPGNASGNGAIEVDTGESRYLLETLQSARLDLYLFGAGHVGKAVVRCLEPLPFRIHWIDSRSKEFPYRLPDNVTTCVASDPVAAVSTARPDSLFLVMTHSHALDEDICHAILERRDFRWLGLIGSNTKRLRFLHRLEARGVGQAQLARLVCPIGIAGVSGKRPATIALAVAAQLMAEQVPKGWK